MRISSIVMIFGLAANAFALAPATAPVVTTAPAPQPVRLALPFAGFAPPGAANSVDLGKARFSDFIDVSVTGGQLALKWVGKIQGTVRFTMDGFDGHWNVQSVQSGNTVALRMVRWSAADPETDKLALISVSLLPQERFSLSVSYGSRSDRRYASLTQGFPALRLSIAMPNGAGIRRNSLGAANIFDLRDKYPADVKKFVADPLTKMTGHNPIVPGLPEAYRRLTEIHADSAVTAKVQEILEKMESRLPEDRAAAMKQLSSLGNAGVLALVRLDPAALTPEQSGRVSEFLSGLDHGAAFTGRSDEALLIDLMEMDDPAIHVAAAKILGVSADASADKLREAMSAATTQPK